ncbi:MAG: hypothetical protein PHI12_06645 [Dehalococcoidales bacterium]|nr:hypothetical protein [Dehalococcoidales bacterium]
MAGILLTNAGNAILYNSVPWSHRLVSLKSQSFPKGAVPNHLRQYLFSKGGVPATCARETAGKSGAARIISMNSCVSAALGRKRSA